MKWFNKIINRSQKVEVLLPIDLNEETILDLINEVLNKQKNNKCEKIYFDFSLFKSVDPIGIVVLSNLIDYLDRNRVDAVFTGHEIDSETNFYLDQCGFFAHHLKDKYKPYEPYKLKRINKNKEKFSYMPPAKISIDSSTNYLYFDLIPWIENELRLAEGSLSTLRTSIEEIFHNIKHHSGENAGYAFVQYAKNRNEMQVIVSDFGLGIPKLVKNKVPSITKDSVALLKACEEGFTTQSNVRNRGAGIPNLIRYITHKGNGSVLIVSGAAHVVASKNRKNVSQPSINASKSNKSFPGTLVRVLLRTNSLKNFVEDIQEEVFEW